MKINCWGGPLDSKVMEFTYLRQWFAWEDGFHRFIYVSRDFRNYVLDEVYELMHKSPIVGMN